MLIISSNITNSENFVKTQSHYKIEPANLVRSYGQTWAEQHSQYTVKDQPGRKQMYQCYQVKILTLKKGSLGIFYYIVDTLVTKLHFCIFSTEGVNKKPIHY